MDQKNENSGNVGETNSGGATKPGLVIGRKIVVVVDSSLEAKGALHWALSHTIQSQDIVVLLYVAKPSSSKQGEESSKEIAPRVSEFLQSMKNMCKRKRPKVKFEVTVTTRER